MSAHNTHSAPLFDNFMHFMQRTLEKITHSHGNGRKMKFSTASLISEREFEIPSV